MVRGLFLLCGLGFKRPCTSFSIGVIARSSKNFSIIQRHPLQFKICSYYLSSRGCCTALYGYVLGRFSTRHLLTFYNHKIASIAWIYIHCAKALFIVIALLNNDASTHIAHTLSGVVPQLVVRLTTIEQIRKLTQSKGLYPSLIIILATLQKTHCDRRFIYGPDASSPVLHTHRSMEIIPSMVQLEE